MTKYQRLYGRNKGEMPRWIRDVAVMTQEQVARALGISQQAVQQAEKSALRKIRAAMKGINQP